MDATLLGSTLPGASRLVRPGETFGGTTRLSETSAGHRNLEVSKSLTGTSLLVLDESTACGTMYQSGIKASEITPMQGSQLEALSVLKTVAGDDAAKLLQSRSLRGVSDLVPVGDTENTNTPCRSLRDSGAGASIGIGLGRHAPARPAPLAEQFYEDEDDDGGCSDEGMPSPMGETLLSDASVLVDNSLGYSASMGSPAACTRAGSRGVRSAAWAPDLRACEGSLSLGDTIAASTWSQTLEASCSSLCYSATRAGAPPGEPPQDERGGDSPQSAGSGREEPAPPAESDGSSTASSCGEPLASSGRGQAHGVDEGKLQAFVAAVQGAEGLGATMRGDLLELLQALPPKRA